MIRKIATSLLVFPLAFLILIVSVFRSAQARYEFVQAPGLPDVHENGEIKINYILPYPGRILPDHFLWPVKVIRDKLWLTVTTNQSKKAEIYLLLADKRLVSSQNLFNNNKPELALSTLTKAEKYLELAATQESSARDVGMDTGEVVKNINLASLKHRQIIGEILLISPEDAKPLVQKSGEYPEKVFEQTKNVLISRGQEAPENPFEDQ